MVTQKSEKTSTTVSNNDSNGNGSQQNCPVCNQGGFQNQNDLAEHTGTNWFIYFSVKIVGNVFSLENTPPIKNVCIICFIFFRISF